MVESSGALVELRSVDKVYEEGRVHALRAVSLTIRQGEFLAVTGPSGSGKSTLLSLIGALEFPDGGTIHFKGAPLARNGDLAAFRARAIGFVFQAFFLIPTLTALENVQVPMLTVERSQRRRRERALELLEAFGLAPRMGHLPNQLSGGEKQRVAIARALANSPELILADEPTGNLDSDSARTVMEAIVQANCRHGATVMIVTHDAGVASRARRTVRLRDGRVVDDSSA
ncbi:MAG: ABC transporter ATP-binding protein [Nitrospirae bacterium]|nr:ABC transporter ATP-binding protein [Nitrospirota bacterium]